MAEYFQFLDELEYIALSPSGELVSLSNPFPFWYVFLVPYEKRDRAKELLSRELSRVVSTL